MRRGVRQALDWGKQIYREFATEHASLTAAAIALFGLLSLFPLLLLAIAGASYALGDPQEALSRITSVLRQVLVGDSSTTLVDVIRGVLESRGVAGFLGVLGFLWASSRVFTIMMEAFNMAWDVERPRTFLHTNLLAIGLVFLTLILGLVIFVTPLALGIVMRYGDAFTKWLGVPINVSGAWPILANVAAWIGTIALFYIFYKYLPNREVPWQSALVGAATAGTLWQVVKYLFQLYLVNFGSYNEVYGALAGVIVLILWLYYSAMILLLGTVTSAVYSTRVFGDRSEQPERRGYHEPQRRAA